MASGGDPKTLVESPPLLATVSSPSDGWIQRIVTPTVIAGVVGGCVGIVSKHRKVHGLGKISATYAANLAIVAGTYCGMREFIRASRHAENGDLINSALGGFASGALLGRLQAGRIGAIRYSVGFAAIGTAIDYTTQKFEPALSSFYENAKDVDSWELPEWSPIRKLDEEQLAAKQAREKQLLEARRRHLD